ncbi:hypothetical protein [Ephemeroptericola cinctiostellae]|nr:hypothetical protein [Ephemeroptericola cinctiostellae]
MSDFIDETDAREQFVLNASIQNARDRAAAVGQKWFKSCQLCSDPTVDGAAYCDDDCLIEARRERAVRDKQFAQRR